MSLDELKKKYLKRYLKRKSMYSKSEAESFIDYFCDKHFLVFYQFPEAFFGSLLGDEAIFNFIYITIRDYRKKLLILDMIFKIDFEDLPLYINRAEEMDEVVSACNWRLGHGK